MTPEEGQARVAAKVLDRVVGENAFLRARMERVRTLCELFDVKRPETAVDAVAGIMSNVDAWDAFQANRASRARREAEPW